MKPYEAKAIGFTHKASYYGLPMYAMEHKHGRWTLAAAIPYTTWVFHLFCRIEYFVQWSLNLEDEIMFKIEGEL